MTIIKLSIKDCTECPKVKYERHEWRKHELFVYFCTLDNDRKIMEYVEWDTDIKPVPKWCPIRAY